MASLNTLRTKFGIVLSIIIALALLAFILSLKTEMGFSGNDDVNQVGKSFEMFPLAFALSVADMEASYYLEGSVK